ncbi:hypothetical protein CXF68_15485 [Tenacibaculum sp. Bg11-29]|uniref:hypothetical protein n=1 Tax=Tenacibaculum sp. Bg11-29 TaxID=2058306 RepID=UPI000C34483A|nr:hypothetical protein [Tenacibaculum sp. Bg11-29]PKH52006.1 hypothetical protein CXF68_15485 [Tenacibaculum sp. Bg11-29]
MYTYQLETCNRKQFLFEFSFEEKESKSSECEDFGCRYVSYKLLRKDKPKDTFIWEGCLCTDSNEIFELSFPDNINIKGEMKLYKVNNECYIFINAHYCYNLENHFEGNILKVPSNIEPRPDPIPVPIPVPPMPVPKPIPTADPVLSNDYNDLFPYLYLKKWPNLTKMEEAYFMNYNPITSSPVVPNLYNSFLSNFNSNGIPAPNAYGKITEEAFNFINGVPPYTDQYITSTATLPIPYKIFPDVYDTIQKGSVLGLEELEILMHEKLTLSLVELKDLINSKKYLELKDRIWQNVFALSVLNFYNAKGLENEIKILLVCNILENILNSETSSLTTIEHLIKASIVLPTPVFPLLAVDYNQNVSSINKTIIPYAIGDLHMIQHKLIGYKPGEIAHIENVLSGEIKERSNALLQEISETTTNSNDVFLRNGSQQLGSLDGLNIEIGNTLSGTDTTIDDYNKLETSYGPPTTGTYNGSISHIRTPDLTENTNDAHFAKKVLNKTIARMGKNIKQVFTRNQVNKTKETIVHTLDNRNNEQNVRGIYNWVNKVYNAQVINYGNRFILEFLIDKPFPKLESTFRNIENGLIAPVNRLKPITSFKSITRENYNVLAADYGVTNVVLPPDELKTFYTFFNEDKVLTAQMLTIEEGYIPSQIEVNAVINADMTLLVGTNKIDLNSSKNKYVEAANTIGIPQNNSISIPIVLNETVSYSPPNALSFYVNVSVSNTPSSRLMNAWKIKVYDAIMKAYKENIANVKEEVNDIKSRNKARRKDLMNKSIIKSCKKMLYELNIKKTDSSSPPSSYLTDVNEPAYYQFFETAMEWGESTYEFYEENDVLQKGKISTAISNFHNNELTDDSLSTKHIRVMVPVTPGFNTKMLYYLSTGLVSWISNIVTPVIEQDKPVTVAIKKASKTNNIDRNIVYEPWEILVPTNMQWLQEGKELPYNTNEIPSI